LLGEGVAVDEGGCHGRSRSRMGDAGATAWRARRRPGEAVAKGDIIPSRHRALRRDG
jgi:molybdopterin biosynthesis enzyme